MFESISRDRGPSDRKDAIGVGFGRAPVGCSPPRFQPEQSVSAVLWDC